MDKLLVLSLVCLKQSGIYMIIALMEFLEGGPDMVSRSQMSNLLKFSKQETREQSVSSFVVRIMKLHLNRSDPSTRNIETNLLDAITNTLKIYRHADILVWVVRPIIERRFANTLFHVTFLDFRQIRVRKSLTRFDTN